ncbi:MmgE/PrpD family protein [Azorhizobium doebereinerae]|uniref:MmgE/PrpD family protein n=1 Tax=Azorhizobium doebereinerae TaxID=281091 RepID=UPI00041B8E15|nr:MmgE/PrpD family protein [Azorhizobium doebereinerae]
MAHETRTLAAFAASLAFEHLPPEVVARAERLVLDYLGNIVRGGAEADSSAPLRQTLARLGLDGPGAATVAGSGRTYAPPVAALLNGVYGHSLDFDDTHAASSLHPSAPVVSAALAAAEMTGADTRTFLAAVVAGYEVCCRLGLAVDPTAHYARGFHPTATTGVFAAAAAAGRIFGLDADRMVTAFGIAGSQAAGSLQFLANGAWTKRYQVGAAAMNGLVAASLALDGFKGSIEALEGTHGFFQGYSGAPRPEEAVKGLGQHWETLEIALKPYPSCRYTHAALDGLLALRAELGLKAEDIRAVTVGLHPNGITLTGAPLADKRRARTVVDGQFSMPFTAAVALDQGSFGWDDYRRLGDPGLDALADRIDVVRDPSLEGLAHPFGATLKLSFAGGEVERRIPDPSGEPHLFPNDAGLKAKFLTLAEPILGTEAAALAEATLALSQARPVADWSRLARP